MSGQCHPFTHIFVVELTEGLHCEAEVGEVVKVHARVVEEVRSPIETSHPLI